MQTIKKTLFYMFFLLRLTLVIAITAAAIYNIIVTF
jgi:hypothetical protein